MLSIIREKVQGWIAGIILGLLAIPFALWGINYYFEGGSLKVAEVNGTEISVDHYRRALDDQKRSIQQMLGGRADPRMFESPEMKTRVLDGLIDRVLVSEDLHSAGYRLSDAELASEIRSAPALQRDGQFDRELYEQFVRSRGMDPRGFEATLRSDYLTRQVESGYAESAIVTASDVERLVKLQLEQREAGVAVLAATRVRDRIKITPEAIEAHYQSHGDQYRTAERVRIDYIRFSVDDMARSVRVSDAEIQQAMADAGRVAKGTEQRRASHILINLPGGSDDTAVKAANEKLQGLRAKIVAGASFAELAKSNSQDAASARQGGDLGVISRGAFGQEFEQALFALRKVGDVTAPVRTPYGLHLIKLTGITGATAVKPDRRKVEAELRTRRAEERFIEMSERFRNLAYEQPDSLKPAADALGMKIESSDWFTRQGSPKGIAAEPKVVAAAFDPEVLEQGRNSPVVELSRNTLIAVRIREREPARQRPLAEVRADIERRLRAEGQEREVRRLGEAAEKDLAGGKTLAAVARQYGMELRPVQKYSRNQKGVDGSLASALFRAPAPADGKPSIGGAPASGGAYAVFEIRSVVHPDKIRMDGPEATAIRRALQLRRGREYYENYKAGLRQDARIKRFKDQL